MMGSNRSFILNVPEYLGPLYKLHLCHDNDGGRQRHWFVHNVMVNDMHAGVKYVIHLL